MDTRSKILESATRLFSAQGYDSTTLSQVARHAEVSKALIFWHFENKENLFQEVVSKSIEPYALEIRLEGLPVPVQLERLIDLYHEFVTENLHSVRFLLGLLLREAGQAESLLPHVRGLYETYRTELATVVARGRASGELARDVDPARHAALILSALNGLLVQGFVFHAAEPAPEVIVAEVKKRLVDAIRVQ